MTEDTITITLPWPDFSLLGGNASGKLRDRMRAKKAARNAGAACALEANGHLFRGRNPSGSNAKVRVCVEFQPPTERAPDDDNAIKALKHFRDGIASVIGIDDNPKRWLTSYTMGPRHRPAKGPAGRVIVTITRI
jgi:crossover junction endodeoxyribonuclease RusA